MKSKLITIIIIAVYLIAYGWRFFYGTYTELQNRQIIESETILLDKAILDKKNEVANLKTDKIVLDDSNLLAVIEKINESDAIDKVIFKKYTTSVAAPIIAYDNVDDVMLCPEADIVELIIGVDDISSFLKEIEDYKIDRLIIYPSDNYVTVDFLIRGNL